METQDLYIVLGVILGGLSIPSILGALAEQRTPWIALLTLVAGAALIGLAVIQRPGVYDFAEIPHAFVRVVAYVLN